MLELINVCKNYENTHALRDVSFSVGPGEIVGLFGENGAGKTTLFKCILNFVLYKGKILLDGEPVTRKNIARLSFATSEHSFFPELTANMHLAFYKEHFPDFDEKRFHVLMEFFRLPANKKLSSFSTGQKNQFETLLSLHRGRITF